MFETMGIDEDQEKWLNELLAEDVPAMVATQSWSDWA